MTWFRVRQWVADSLWVVPLVCGVAGWALSVGLIELDEATPSIAALDFTSATATQLLAAFAGAAVAFTGFAFSVLLLVVQLASSQLSPRATRLAYRSRLSKISLGLWVGTLAYSVSVLESVTGGFVPQISVAGAGILVFVSVVVFLLLIGRTSRILRPGPMAELCVAEGRKTIARMHPAPFDEADPAAAPEVDGPESVIRHEGRGGVIVSMDLAGLVREAARAECLLVASPCVGDYVAPGNVLFRARGGEPDPGRVRRAVIVGAERSFELDPLLPLRILADISIRALSPAVNDPTSSVQALKRIHDLLSDLAGRRLGPWSPRGPRGRVRLVMRGPSWEQYLAIGLAETIRYGAGSPQVARALREVLLTLRAEVPEARRAAVEARLALLDEAVAREYPGPLSRAEALVPGPPGLRALASRHPPRPLTAPLPTGGPSRRPVAARAGSRSCRMSRASERRESARRRTFGGDRGVLVVNTMTP